MCEENSIYCVYETVVGAIRDTGLTPELEPEVGQPLEVDSPGERLRRWLCPEKLKENLSTEK